MRILLDENMPDAILIQANARDLKLLQELADRLGAKVTKVKDAPIEDLMLGAAMDRVKTGKTVSRKRILKKLKKVSSSAKDPLLAPSGFWKDRDITLEDLRTRAWSRS